MLHDPHLTLNTAAMLLGDDALVTETVSTFFGSLQSKLIGFVLGNLLAALVFAFISQAVASAVAGKAEEKRGPLSLGDRLGKLNPGSLLTLLLSLSIDLAGDSSFVLPGVGELEDVAWAPVSALLLRTIYNSNAVAGLDFIKEALPFTDVVPVATLAWASKNLFPESPVSKALGLAPEEKK